ATALASATGTVVVGANAAQAATLATLVDSNGTTLLGYTAANNANTSVGASLTSSNTATLTGANDIGLAWNSSGGNLNLNGASTTDATARTPSAPFYLGATGGASNSCNCDITRLTIY